MKVSLTAADIVAGGQIEIVLPRDQMRAHALELAREIVQNSPDAIRAGKAAFNGIENILNLEESYRFAHAFTPELFVSSKAAARRAIVFNTPS